ncbi:MAG: response regulator [Chloroflexi bacterium]|nr:response regulator [Chloroflexota bacterium]
MATILVVDDEVGALTLIGIMLERGGFDVIKARDAYAALEALEEHPPDLIILDVMMPGMNGIELCRRIRERPETTEIPIVMLSARGEPASVDAGLEAGADDYLQKPILHHDLLSKIRKMLDLQSVD